MTTMAAEDAVFFDTNIVLRSSHPQMDLHEPVYAFVQQIRATGVQLWVSRQVMRECLVQMTHEPRGGQPLVPLSEALRRIEQFERLFEVADETAVVAAQLRALLREVPKGGRQVHDANIVATMLAYNIPTLVTLNTADMRRFAPRVAVVSPLDPTA